MKRKNIIAILLALIIAVSNTVGASASINYSSTKKVFTVVEDGIEYNIEVWYNSNSNVYDFTITNSESDESVDLLIDKDEETMEVTTSLENGSIKTENYDLSDSGYEDANTVFNTQAIKYNSKTYEKWKEDYWYCYGSKGSKTYLKIGCVASYRIRTDNLNSKKEDKCTKYTDSIKKCNSSFNKALAYSVASGVGIGVITGLVIANIAFPPSVIVTIIIAVCGSGSSVVLCANSCIDAYNYYCDVKDYYVTIRSYGKKL